MASDETSISVFSRPKQSRKIAARVWMSAAARLMATRLI
jgi:hypothetical protein